MLPLSAQPEADTYRVYGIVRKVSPTQVEISELPVSVWTCAYRDKTLATMLTNGKIRGFDENHGDAVHYSIRMTDAQMAAAEKEGLESYFNLWNTVSTTNMVMFNTQGKIAIYKSPTQILREFCLTRYEFYLRRKAYLLHTFAERLVFVSNKLRFILAVRDEELKIKDTPKRVVVANLEAMGFDAMDEDGKRLRNEEPIITTTMNNESKQDTKKDTIVVVTETKNSMKQKEEVKQVSSATTNKKTTTTGAALGSKRGGKKSANTQSSSSSTATTATSTQQEAAASSQSLMRFDYLLNMSIGSLTIERLERLREEKQEIETKMATLKMKHATDLWNEDIEAFVKAYDENEVERLEQKAAAPKGAAASKKSRKGKLTGKRLCKGKDGQQKPAKQQQQKKTTTTTAASSPNKKKETNVDKEGRKESKASSSSSSSAKRQKTDTSPVVASSTAARPSKSPQSASPSKNTVAAKTNASTQQNANNKQRNNASPVQSGEKKIPSTPQAPTKNVSHKRKQPDAAK